MRSFVGIRKVSTGRNGSDDEIRVLRSGSRIDKLAEW
jgi:hypothetical protein